MLLHKLVLKIWLNILNVKRKLLIQNLTPYLPLLYNMNKNKNYKTFFTNLI